jgi:GH35 family endo-1,4-beta-xylanase
MNRRDFLKAMGLGTASLAMPGCASVLQPSGSKMSKDQILDGADARIEKHRKGNAKLKLLGPDGKPLNAGLTVNIQQTNHKFLFGSNIFRLHQCETPRANAAYEKHFAELLNFATLPFYWARYEPERGKPNDDRTREIVKWCKVNNVTPKGHPLVWNLADPKWLPKKPEKAMEVQFERARQCTERFKGNIDIWDVVNEATHYDRDRFLERAPILTEAITKMGVGEYVRRSFEAARQGNPDATLIINDYRADDDFEHKVVSQLVDDAGRQLYDVIGIQSHMHVGYWGVELPWNICERFAKFGKPIHFTELTLLSGKLKEDDDWFSRRKGWHTTEEGEKRQARQVTELYTLLFSHPAVEAVTVWDFTDYNAWQGAPSGYLRTDMTPKPAYNQLKELIKGKWWTKTKTTLKSNGKSSFRGFYGQYKVKANLAGRRLTGTFQLDKNIKQPINVRMN